MKTHTKSVHTLARIALLFAACLSTSEAVQIATPAEADLQISEDGGIDTGSAGDAANVNALYDQPTNEDPTLRKNEIIALRFNLAGKNRAQSTKAWLKLINAKQQTTNQKLYFYGVAQGAKGYNETTSTAGTFTDNDWQENGTVLSTTPGLRFDGNAATGAVDTSLATFLGEVNVDNGNRDEGAELVLSTSELQDFLINHPDDVVTILVTSSTIGNSQKRFATKEATHLNSGTGVGGVWQTGDPEVAAGTYAPRLVLDLPGTVVKASADAQVRELDAGSATPPVFTYDTGSGTGTSMNVRWNTATGAERNFVIALRFDLTNVTPSQITAADLRLVSHRAGTSFHRLHFYGVNDGAKGRNAVTNEEGTFTDNDWPENGTKFSTMPGLEYDGLNAPPSIPPAPPVPGSGSGVMSDRVTDLGTTYVSAGNRTADKGSEVVLSTDKLKNFLINHPDRIVTILVITDLVSSNGDKRFATKEATGLDGDAVDTVPAGTYAPSLNLMVAAPETFAIKDITLSSGKSQISLTWESQPGQVFRITHSQNLNDGFTGVVLSDIAADAGATTTRTFQNPQPSATRLFLRVERP